jgi:predicted DNA-binding transcriptional regulator YafY
MLREQFGLKDSQEKIIGYDSNIDYSGYEFIAPFFNAISNKQVLKVKYRSFEGEEYSFEFHPYYLRQYNNRWFVLGYNAETKVEQWVMPLDRIVQMEEINGKYKTNSTDWEDYFYDFVGVTKLDGDIEEVQLRFSKNQAPYVRTKPLHPSQRIEKMDNGELKVRLQIIPNYELERLILSFGEDVEVLQPTNLRRTIAERINNTKSLY